MWKVNWQVNRENVAVCGSLWKARQIIKEAVEGYHISLF